MSHDNPCPYCDYNANNPKRMESHLKHRIPGEAYFCKICDKKWCIKLGMLRHVQVKHNIKTKPKEEPHDVTKFICEVCDFVANTRFSLKKHLSTKHKDYHIENIPTYSKIKQLNNKENSEDVTKILSDQTGNINVQDSDSDIPDFEHDPENVFIKSKQDNIQDDNETKYQKCQYCDFSVLHCNRNRMDNHLKCRKKGQLFSCKFCPKKWCTRTGLTAHMYRSHTDMYIKRPKFEKKPKNDCKKNIKCQFCDLVTNKGGIAMHMRNRKENSGTELKVCDICGFKSCTKRHLKKHKSMKHSANPLKKNQSGYQCERCDYTTKTLKFYKRHQTFQKEDKDNILYKCKASNGCGIKLCSEGAFLTHRYLKHGIRKPTSDILKQQILSNSAVDQLHHSNSKSDKKVLCKYCPFSTCYKQNLARHIHNRHGNVDDMEEMFNVKIYNVLPKPVKGTWIVVLEKLEE